MVRVFHGSRWGDEDARGAFQERAEALGRLDHPHLARQLQAGCLDDGRPYVVSEDLDGEDLAAHLRQAGPLTPDELALLILPLAAVLEELRASGIVVQALPAAQVFLVGGLTRFEPKLIGPGLGDAGRDFDPRGDVVALGRLMREACPDHLGWMEGVHAGCVLTEAEGGFAGPGRRGPGAARGAAEDPALAHPRGGSAPSAPGGGLRAGEAGRHPRPVPARAGAGRGSDGPGVPGAAREPGAAGGGEGAPGRARPEHAPHPALLPRGPGGQPDQPRAHRGDPRLRRGDRGRGPLPRLLRDGDARGPEPHRAARQGAAERGAGGGHHPAGLRRARTPRTRWASSTGT